MNGNIQKLQTIGWVLDCSPTKGNDRLCLLVFANHADKHGLSCFPGTATLQSEMYVGSRNTVFDTINRLEAAGDIVVARFDNPGKGDSNHYGIVMGETEGAKRRRISHAGEWLSVMDALREEMAPYIEAGKKVIFSPAPKRLAEEIDELLDETQKQLENALAKGADSEHFEMADDQEKSATRARTNPPISMGADSAPLGDQSARSSARTFNGQSARKGFTKGSVSARPERARIMNTEFRNSSSSEKTEVVDNGVQEEQKFSKIRQALLGRDGRSQAHLSGSLKSRVEQIASVIDETQTDLLVDAIYAESPDNAQVPWLVEWLEGFVGSGDTANSSAARQGDLTGLIIGKRNRLRVVMSHVDAGDDDVDLIHEADDLRGQIHDLETQLGEDAPEVMSVG